MASTSTSNIILREQDKIFLIGTTCNQIIGSKLPSKGQALRVLFFNMRKVKLNLHESAKLVIQEIVVFWQKARIPVRQEYNSINKLESLYEEWRILQKHATRKTEINIKKQECFVNELDDLFDIAHMNALNIIKIEIDRQFLLSQREKGRIGCMLGKDKKLQKIEERSINRLEAVTERKKRAYEEIELASKIVIFYQTILNDSINLIFFRKYC